MVAKDKMLKLNWSKWSLATLCGLILGGFCSLIPVFLWEKVVLNQGDEFEIDVLIVSAIAFGGVSFVWRSIGMASAIYELFIIISMSSVVTGGAVVVVDSCRYQSAYFFCLLKAIGVAIVFALPAMMLACGFLLIFTRRFR